MKKMIKLLRSKKGFSSAPLAVVIALADRKADHYFRRS